MNIYYNPLDLRCKSTIGGIRQNEKLKIRVFCDLHESESCQFVLQKDGDKAQTFPMRIIENGAEIEICLSDCGLYFYRFHLRGHTGGCGKFCEISFSDNAAPYQILVYAEDFETPDWFKGGVMYQIFPDRFARSGATPIESDKWLHENWDDCPEYRPDKYGKILNNDFFGGNFRGMTEKIGYLKSLHITVVYLNPIFKAFSNHRYDTGDYMQIDPLLGDESDFVNFVQECEKNGIRVILDGVFNHTGADSRYFNKYGHYDDVGAFQSIYSKYYAWYNFKKFPNEYDCWWGIDILPAVNEHCKSYIDFITGDNGVLKHWMRKGIAGFRLDVADELPDEFIEKIRAAIQEIKPDALLIGEVWEDASNKISYSKRREYFYGKELDGVMNYPLKDAIIQFVTSGNTDLLRQTIDTLLDHYPKPVLDSLMNILGTHDTSRILTVLCGQKVFEKEEMAYTRMTLSERKEAAELLKCAAVLVFTLFGVPCIYYGDEIGMEGYADPFCRRTFSWGRIDDDLLRFFQQLGEIRSRLEVFKEGIYKEIFADSGCIVYERRTEFQLIIAAVNRSQNKYDICFNGKMFDLLHVKDFNGKFTVKPNSYAVLSNVCLI